MLPYNVHTFRQGMLEEKNQVMSVRKVSSHI